MNFKGYTLIELLITVWIAIVAILTFAMVIGRITIGFHFIHKFW